MKTAIFIGERHKDTACSILKKWKFNMTSDRKLYSASSIASRLPNFVRRPTGSNLSSSSICPSVTTSLSPVESSVTAVSSPVSAGCSSSSSIAPHARALSQNGYGSSSS